MTQRSLFWEDGIGHGGPYSGDALRLLTTALAGNPATTRGVMLALNHLAVSSVGNNNVRVLSGRAMVDGSIYENDATVDLTIDSPLVGTTGGLVVLRKDWTARTITITHTLNDDGDDSIPDPVEDDGVTWEQPLGSFTITTGGVIDDVTDRRQFLGAVAGGWEFIDAVVLDTAVPSIEWTGLDTAYRQFRVTLTALHAATSLLYLRLNGDSGSNYANQHVTASSTGVTAGRTTSQSQMVVGSSAASAQRTTHILIGKLLAAGRASAISTDGMGGTGTAVVVSTHACDWSNVTDLIDQITLLASTGNFAIGSRFVLEGERWP